MKPGASRGAWLTPCRKIYFQESSLLIITLPIFLTFTRLFGASLLAPLVCFFLAGASEITQWVFMGIFLFLASTDLFDGLIARARGQESSLGRDLDPVADKFLVVGCLLALLAIGRLSFWAVFLLVMREIAVMSLRVIAVDRARVILVSTVARLKTTVQVMLIAYTLSPLGASTTGWGVAGTQILSFAAVALAWYSAIQYGYGFFVRDST